MLERVFAVAADVFGVAKEDLRADSSPDTIPNWDSLQHLNFVLALEQEFEIQFTPEEIEQLLSIELTLAFVEEKQKEHAPATQ